MGDPACRPERNSFQFCAFPSSDRVFMDRSCDFFLCMQSVLDTSTLLDLEDIKQEKEVGMFDVMFIYITFLLSKRTISVMRAISLRLHFSPLYSLSLFVCVSLFDGSPLSFGESEFLVFASIFVNILLEYFVSSLCASQICRVPCSLPRGLSSAK